MGWSFLLDPQKRLTGNEKGEEIYKQLIDYLLARKEKHHVINESQDAKSVDEFLLYLLEERRISEDCFDAILRGDRLTTSNPFVDVALFTDFS